MLRQISTATTLLDFFRQLLEGAPHVDALEMDFAAAATTSIQSVAHGLRRPYRAVEVLYQDAPVTLYAMPPRDYADSDRRIYFQLGAATASNFHVRCY